MQAPLVYSHDTSPATGTTVPIMPGIEWICMPLPFALNHINLWLLAEEGGYATIDTGIATPEVREAWNTILANRTLTRAIVTHLHPDHVGMASWLEQEKGAQLAVLVVSSTVAAALGVTLVSASTVAPMRKVLLAVLLVPAVTAPEPFQSP